MEEPSELMRVLFVRGN